MALAQVGDKARILARRQPARPGQIHRDDHFHPPRAWGHHYHPVSQQYGLLERYHAGEINPIDGAGVYLPSTPPAGDVVLAGVHLWKAQPLIVDVLRASGAGTAETILVCVDKPEVADRIVELVRHEFPQAQVLVRSFDREHSLALIGAGVDYQIRETFESAVEFGKAALMSVGASREDAETIALEIRRRDAERDDVGQRVEVGAKHRPYR